MSVFVDDPVVFVSGVTPAIATDSADTVVIYR